MNDKLEFNTFKEAVKCMYDRVLEDIEAHRLTWQVLETMVWIEPRDRSAPIMFYAARDIAAELGWYQEWEK